MNASLLQSTLYEKRIFLTGGTGLFGKWLLDYFKDLNMEVVVLSRNPEHFVNEFPVYERCPHISFVKGDVRDFIFPDGAFDYVIHAATPVTSDDLGLDDPEVYSIIVEGTQRVLEFAEQAGVERFLNVSSGAVYGVQPSEVEAISEEHVCKPVNAYGRGKLEAERLCYESSVSCVSARCFSFVGPGMPLDAHFAIGNFIGNALRGEPIVIEGDGTPLRTYLYSEDLVEGLLILMLKGQSGEVYNVGGEKPVSIAEVAELVREVAGIESKVIVAKDPVLGALPSSYVPCIDKIRGIIDVRKQVALEDAVYQILKLSGEDL